MGSSRPEEWDTIEWFREGFVAYYGYLLAFRASLMELPRYVESINRDLWLFPTSTSAYVRGRVIAFWLDQQIRKSSGGKRSLDNVMYDILRGAAKPLTQSRSFPTAGRYLSPASRTELARIIQPNSPTPNLNDTLGPCVRGSMHGLTTFDLGFDLAASSAAGSITGVLPGSAAFRAGLGNGQRLYGKLSVYNNQPEKIAIVEISDGEATRAIEYYPKGAPVHVMHYHLDIQEYAANPASCQIK